MSLQTISILVGLFVIAVRLPGLLQPAKYRDFAVKFPRHLGWGRALMALVAAIVWWIMYHAAVDDWRWAQPVVLFGVPIAYWLLYQFPPHYLSLRAVAALMLLVAKQMVDAADVSESSLRLVVTVFAYLWVVTAIWMASAPHQLRDIIGFAMKNDQRCRLACLAGTLVGVGLVALGVFAY